MMNKKILPENIQNSEYNNLKKQESFLDNMEIFKSTKKDIRFLISRDLDWVPQVFSEITTFESTLKYPGTQNRNR